MLPVSTTAQEMKDVAGFSIEAPFVKPDRDFGILAPGPVFKFRIRCWPGTRLSLVEVVDNMARSPFGSQIFALLEIFSRAGTGLSAKPDSG